MTLWLWCSRCGYQPAAHGTIRCPSCQAPVSPAVNQSPTPEDLQAARATIQALPALCLVMLARVRERGERRFHRFVLP